MTSNLIVYKNPSIATPAPMAAIGIAVAGASAWLDVVEPVDAAPAEPEVDEPDPLVCDAPEAEVLIVLPPVTLARFELT